MMVGKVNGARDMKIKKLKLKKLKLSKKAYWTIGGVVGVLCVCYVGLCFVAGGKDFLSNTTINGLDVGDMTKEEAILALNKQYQKDTKDLILTLTIDDKSYQVDMKDNVTFDSEKAIKDICDQENAFFLSRGYHYLFGHDYTIAVKVKDKDKFQESITNSQILDYNTVVDTTYEVKEDKIVFTKGKSGEKAQQKDVVKTIQKALSDYDFKNKIEYEPTQCDMNDEEMEAIHKDLSKGAKDATLDKNNNYEIVDSQVGVKYDLDEAIKAFDKADEGEKFTLKADITQPKITKEMLEQNLFKDVLGQYSTSVSGTSVRKNNVRLAGEKCNNVILLPGEEFSYNGTVGKRTKENGFGEAGAYLNGETVQEVGGGVCQTSSTLYNAVLLSNLKITERTNHTYVSSYVPAGRDATVSWGGPDFKFKNDKDYPIKIVSSYQNSTLTMTVYGTNVDNIRVEIKSQRLSSTGYNTKYEDDPTLLEGQTKVKQKGTEGCKAQSWRYVYDANGNLISSDKEAYSVYKGHEEIVLRGTMKAPEQPATPTEPAQPTPEQPAQPTDPSQPALPETTN